MPNTETFAGKSSIAGKIDSTGQTSAITVRGSRLLDISIDFDTNSFVGTIVLQRETRTGASNVVEWANVEAGYTESTEKVAQSATTRRYRLDCTVATSGTAEYELTAGNFS